MKKIICLILSVIIPLSVLSGCGKNGRTLSYNSKKDNLAIDSGNISENKNFSLDFDSDTNTISLLCKDTGKVWTNLSYDNDKTSTLDIRVQDTRVVKESTYESGSATKITSESIENGVKVTYYFDYLKISVPVCYTLREDSVLISVTGKDIQQGDERYQLIAVLPSPLLCSVKSSDEDSYLFSPNGIGGTISNKTTVDAEKKQFGTNANIASMAIESNSNDSDSTGFRCYGVKNGNNAAFCIAEDTPGAVGVNLLAGNRISDYAYIYPTFTFADYDYFYGIAVTDGLLKQVSDLYLGTVSVGFYPLSGEDANYNGFAKLYRNYLTKTGYIVEDNKCENSSPYAITYLGGVLSTDSILGIPTKTLKVLTSFENVLDDTEKLYESTGIMPTVRLTGYGTTGINIGKIAGGYKFDSSFGNDSQRKKIEDYITSNNSSVYSDFSLLFFSKSGNGFKYSKDYAKTAVLHAAEISPVNTPLRDFNDSLKFRLLARSNIGKAVDKLIKMAKKNDISGLSIEDLGSNSYSDYSDGVKYAVTANMNVDAKKYLTDISDSDFNVAVSSPTYYSAGLIDTIFDAPLEPSGKYIFDTEIPFYQMVFHGVTPMYSSAINSSTDANYKIMLAASTGTGLGFSLINNFDSSYMETNADKLYAMLFGDSQDLIKNSLKKYSNIYNSVQNSKIISYDMIDANVSKTTFENGISIYANHSSSACNSPVGKLDGYDFIMNGGNAK